MPDAETNRPLHILVIDDDVVMSEVLSALFGMKGHTVLVADSGDAALPMIADTEHRLDVIVTDLQMPGLQGHKLAETLASLRQSTTLLIGMSGSLPSAAEMKPLDAFVQKPFSMADFDAALANCSSTLGAEQQTTSSKPDTGNQAPALDEEIFTRMADAMPAEQLRELYELTVTDTLQRIARMEASQRGGDHEAVRREAHAIKGGCGMVGAAELHQLAAETEGGSAGSTPPLADFTAACERLRRMLDERLK